MTTAATKTFTLKAPWIIARLREDFDLTAEQAAGILGNLGHESAGLTAFQEVGPTAGRGGFGWAQWTGPRRVQFESYCARNKLNLKGDKANYAWLFLELKRAFKGTIKALKKADSLEEAVIVFEKNFEKARVKNYPSRTKWAQLALDAYRGAEKHGLVAPPKPIVSTATKVQEMTINLPAPGKIAGVASAVGSVALILGFPQVAALIGLVTPENVEHVQGLITLAQTLFGAGGALAGLAGFLPAHKAA
jgi:hypothetical protein